MGIEDRESGWEFVQEPIDYRVTGSRRWTDLTGAEQDEYLLACFQGEAARAAAERRLDIFDRVAGSVAGDLLGVFYQYDIHAGVSRYEPGDPARARRVLLTRLAMLSGTPLGERLRAAVERRGVAAPDYSSDPVLPFETIAPAPGMEVLTEEATGGLIESGDDRGPHEWNDFAELDRRAAYVANDARELRWEREMNEAPPPQAPPLRAPLTAAEIHTPSPARATGVPRQLLLAPVGWAVVVLLLWAVVPDNPYSYYVLLRWVCTPVFAVTAWNASQRGSVTSAWGLALLALVFNPLVPLHLDRAWWAALNVIGAASLAGSLLQARRVGTYRW